MSNETLNFIHNLVDVIFVTSILIFVVITNNKLIELEDKIQDLNDKLDKK